MRKAYPEMEFEAALRVAKLNRVASNFPRAGDPRLREGSLFPSFVPKFNLEFGPQQSVFTLGSCFARNVEEALQSQGVKLPTMAFSVPKSEWGHRSNGLLNEYTPGTMSQRIVHAIEGRPFPEQTIVETETGHADLLLQGGADVARERALQRRKEIDAIYSELPKSTCMVVTLGFVEAWFDSESGVYLNRMPPPPFARKHPKRFLFRRLDLEASYELLERAFQPLADLGIKIVLTVSPVPIQRTFTPTDCVTANEYSKAVLRTCSDMLEKRFANVDYFPSYEVVKSGGLTSYIDDNVHVKDEVVRRIVAYMIEQYCRATVTS